MRKRFKKKVRACALCKPHKRGKAPRIEGKALRDIKEFEALKREEEK